MADRTNEIGARVSCPPMHGIALDVKCGLGHMHAPKSFRLWRTSGAASHCVYSNSHLRRWGPAACRVVLRIHLFHDEPVQSDPDRRLRPPKGWDRHRALGKGGHSRVCGGHAA